MPSRADVTCSPFSSIASNGTRLAISGQDDAILGVDLPFSFSWRGEVEYTRVTVATNGVLFPGVNNVDDGCCVPEPITIFGRYLIPRISVAQTDIAPSGRLYTAHIDDAFIISWEGVFEFGMTRQNALNFQAVLFENGNVELRWGQGNPVVGHFAAGLEDEPAGVIVPATGFPFDGSLGAGVSTRWPQNQCRVFEVSNNGMYTEDVE